MPGKGRLPSIIVSRNQELVTEGEVSRVGGSDSDQVPRLQDKVAELQAEIAHLTAINRRLTRTVSMQRLDIASGPESDVEDTEEYRLCLEDDESSPKKYDFLTKDENGVFDHMREEGRVRIPSSGSDRSTPSPSREPLNRKTSQTLADAFLEQLPEVRVNDDAYQNGSATCEEREAC